MGQGGPYRPKSLILISLWIDHRAALQYDWHRAWGGPLDLKTLSLHEAWPMCREILKDRSSHSWAALAGWSFIPDPADKYIHAANQGTAKHRMLTPAWEKPDKLLGPEHAAARPAPKRDERLRGRLKARLGLHD